MTRCCANLNKLAVTLCAGGYRRGAGGALGSQLWAGLSALVRRSFRRAHTPGDGAVALSSGSAELAALEQLPGDEHWAIALAEVLVARAEDCREPLAPIELPAEGICGVLLWSGDRSPVWGCTTTSGDQVPPRTRWVTDRTAGVVPTELCR